MQRCIVRGNMTGGISIATAGFQIINSIIVGNQGAIAAQNGLAIANAGETPQEIFFTTIADNQQGNISCTSNSDITVDSSILWDGAIVNTTGACVINNSTIPSGAAGNNIDDDPLFVDKINYELSQNSPAIDKGDTQTLTDNNITTDLDGTLRPQGTAPDMGAQEFAE